MNGEWGILSTEHRTQNKIKSLIHAKQDLFQGIFSGIKGIEGIGKTCNGVSGKERKKLDKVTMGCC